MNRWIGLALLTFAVLTLRAQAQPHVAYVPAVARTAGLNGSLWVSELRVFNPSQGASAHVDAYLLTGANGNSAIPASFTVAPRTVAKFDDVLASLFTLNSGVGAIRLVSDQPIAATSVITTRASVCSDSEATVTQFLPAVSADRAATAVRVDHFTSTADVRANAGFLNTAGTDAHLTIRLVDGTAGATLGEGTLTLPPLGWYQINGLAEQLFLFEDVPAGMIEVTADVPVIAYASMISNRTNDAFTVVGEPVP